MNIIAIDPGMRNTGIVYMSELSIVCSKTISGPSVKNDNYKSIERAERITQQILVFMADKPHETVVIEGYAGGFAGRQNAYSHQTPFLFGYIIRALQSASEPYVVQLSSEVLNPRSKRSVISYEDAYPNKNRSKVNALERSGWRGVETLKSDHTRAAALHGIYYYHGKER